MTAPYDLNDNSVVVIIGTGAGGGTLANELAQKGIDVVALEAGARHLPPDYLNDEWASFGQLAWLDMRTTSGDWRLRDHSGFCLSSVLLAALPPLPTHCFTDDVTGYQDYFRIGFGEKVMPTRLDALTRFVEKHKRNW